MTLKDTIRLIQSDVRRRIEYDRTPPGFFRFLIVLTGPANLALSIWRFENFFASKRIPLVNKMLSILNLVFFAMEIEPEAQIEEGFLVLNPNGIMIHNHTKIGKNCTFVHQVTATLGPRVGLDPINDRIVIGENVTVSAGVRIIGNLTIGDSCWIGPNCVVADSVPANSRMIQNRIEPLAFAPKETTP
jgi:serine O-acetyltransferase